MKITEITDKNLIWQSLLGDSYDKTISSYNLIKAAWPTILSSKSPARIQYYKDDLSRYLDIVHTNIANLDKLPDQDDPDVAALKQILADISVDIHQLIHT